MNFVFFKRACKLEGGGEEPDGNPNQNNTAMKYQLIIYINKPLLYQYMIIGTIMMTIHDTNTRQYIAFIRRVLIEIIWKLRPAKRFPKRLTKTFRQTILSRLSHTRC